MMELRGANLAKVLYSLDLDESIVKDSLQILWENHELVKALSNPAVLPSEKAAVIDKIFVGKMRSYLKMLCLESSIDLSQVIWEEYEKLYLSEKNMIKATLFYAEELTQDEIKQMEEMICQKYNKVGVRLELKEDTSLLGGYVLKVGDTVYDNSIKEALIILKKTLAGR